MIIKQTFLFLNQALNLKCISAEKYIKPVTSLNLFSGLPAWYGWSVYWMFGGLGHFSAELISKPAKYLAGWKLRPVYIYKYIYI